jgi:ornithine racemase
MKLPTPRLEIYPAIIEDNARSIIQLCHSHNIQVVCVTKVVCANPAIVTALEKAGADLLADSRLENLKSIRESGTSLPLMLLRAPSPDQAADTVEYADISLNSSVETIRQLSLAAAFKKKTHQVILMVDLGDLREGVWPDRVPDVLRSVSNFTNIEIIGLGCNLMCYGGVIPTTEKMNLLIDLRDTCQKELRLDLPVINGGNSANLPLLLNNEMPAGINQLRLGESILLGRSVIDRSPWPGTRQDTFRVVAQVIELEKKPSLPIGVCGQDAFGGFPTFVDRGIRSRAICNIGRQDIVVDALEPEDPGIIILGGSSDHLILDVKEAKTPVSLGSEIIFYPGYSALLAASTSPYVHKVIINN